MHYNHTLTIGTTGMLTEATRELFKESKHLTCIARTSESLGRLEPTLSNLGNNFYPITADYQATDDFMTAIEQAWNIAAFDLIVVWMHSSGERSLIQLIEFLSNQTQSINFLHVVGSAVANPNQKAESANFKVGDNLKYHQVILGFQIENSNSQSVDQWVSRWLTHKEISQGVLEAIREKKEKYIIGTVKPWSARP